MIKKISLILLSTTVIYSMKTEKEYLGRKYTNFQSFFDAFNTMKKNREELKKKKNSVNQALQVIKKSNNQSENNKFLNKNKTYSLYNNIINSIFRVNKANASTHTNNKIIKINAPEHDSQMIKYLKDNQIEIMNDDENNPDLIAQNNKILNIIKTYHLYTDIIISIFEINRINLLNCKSPNIIKIDAFIKSIEEIIKYHEDFQSSNGILIRIMMNNKFLLENIIIYAHADKIARYHKESGKNLSKAKIIQYIWLAVNKLAPYTAFAITRKFSENCNISNIFKEYKNDKTHALSSYKIIRSISYFSEILRKSIFNYLHMGEYKKYKTDN
ncbi:MAG: hypothetical protein M0R03_16665 [Novosphingobium sp.]|nr:hypothetical protein [Novosphingobium sp.]